MMTGAQAFYEMLVRENVEYLDVRVSSELRSMLR